METTKNKTTLLIMAAGMGSRFGSLKQLALLGPHKKTLLHYAIDDAVHAGFDKIVFIIRRSFENEFKEAVGKYAESLVQTVYCFQEMDQLPGNLPPMQRGKRWGSGDGICAAKDHIHEPFIAINADDFYGRDAFVKMHDFVASNTDERCFSLAGYRLAATLSENGTVSRGICTVDEDNLLTSITEHTKIGREGNAIKDLNSGVILHEDDVVSMNFWGFSPMLFEEIEKQFIEFYHKNSENPKAEIYIPFVVDELIKQKAVKVKVLNTSAKWFGVTYKEDKSAVMESISKIKAQGVYSEKLWD